MKKYWYWIELIGFDAGNIEQSVETFLGRTGGAEGVSLLLFSADFVNSFTPGDADELSPAVCSYAGHPSNGERERQVWTKGQLKALVAALQKRSIKVLLCVFNMYLYHLDGKEVCEGFGAEHPEINERCRDGSLFQVVSMIKRMKDGSDYGEYFIRKLTQAVAYYGFDGVQIADGISSARLPVERSDYSDDLVQRFVQTGGTLPAGTEVSVGDDPVKIAARAEKIFSSIRPQWTRFIATLWGNFVKKLTGALKEQGKFTLVNTTWTRDPAEAYIRYGMDYACALDGNVDALMVEENAQTMAEGGVMHYAGVKASLKRRARLAYEGYVMQLALKAMFPGLAQITMCPIRDNQEQFDTLRCAYTEITKSSALRNMAVCYNGKGYVPVSDNLLYTLSDAVTENEWKDLHGVEAQYALPQADGGKGLLAVFSRKNTQKEAERYFESRALTSWETYVRWIMGGLPVTAGADVSDLAGCSQPAIAANAELYDAEEIEALEKYAAPLFTSGYGRVLKKEPDAVFYVNGADGYAVYGYNLGGKASFDCKTAYSRPTGGDEAFGSFTAPLGYEKIPHKFFRRAAAEIAKLLALPVLAAGTGCKCFPTSSQGKEVYVITSDSYFYELPQIDTRKRIASVQSRTKMAGYRVETEGTKFSVLVNNRGAEAVRLTFAQEKEGK